MKKYHYSGEPQVLESWCRTCKRIDDRIRLGIKRHGKPMRSMEEKRVLGTRPLTETEKQKRYFARMKRERPARYRRFKREKAEYQRFRRAQLKAEEKRKELEED